MFGRVELADFETYKSNVSAEFINLKNEISILKKSVQSGLEALHTEIKSNSTVSDEVARQAAASAVESEKNVKILRIFLPPP